MKLVTTSSLNLGAPIEFLNTSTLNTLHQSVKPQCTNKFNYRNQFRLHSHLKHWQVHVPFLLVYTLGLEKGRESRERERERERREREWVGRERAREREQEERRKRDGSAKKAMSGGAFDFHLPLAARGYTYDWYLSAREGVGERESNELKLLRKLGTGTQCRL